jgi:hypothetical protein
MRLRRDRDDDDDAPKPPPVPGGPVLGISRMRLFGGATVILLLVSIALAGQGLGTLAYNRRAAHKDVLVLLHSVALPAGARRAGSEPAGDHGYLRPLEALEVTSARAVSFVWWIVPGSPHAVIAYLRAHPPAGGRLSGSGQGGARKTGATDETLYYDWPGKPRVLSRRELALTATALPSGRTGLLIEAQSDWVVPRPVSTRIPASTRVVQITSRRPDKRPRVSITVTGPTTTARIVELINGLPEAQPGVTACPNLTDPLLITMRFRASRSGPLLASLSYTDFRPWSAPAGACSPLHVTVTGGGSTGLTGGRFLTTIERLIQVRLT